MKFKLTKGKIIAGAVIIAILAAALFWGGFGSKGGDTLKASPSASQASDTLEEHQSAEDAVKSADKQDKNKKKTVSPSPSASPSVSPSPSVTPSPAAAPTENSKTEPQPAKEEVSTCTISIRCDTILNNMDKLKDGKSELVPSDGYILYVENFEFSPGDTVFDVLKNATQQYGVHLEYTYTPAYNSSYIEGIGNLYEFDCGEVSGWMYSLDGTYKSTGCSSVTVSDGDTITWSYTCDLGRDL